MAVSQNLQAHLDSGATTLCRAWAVTRRDGTVMGFTDHDCALSFEGVDFRANAGMTARTLTQTTGLSVDNSEALGALSDVSVRDEDILAGRYDGAEVRSWLVNWANPDDRVMQFRGTIGEITRIAGAFQAELRGLAEALNQPQGRVYQSTCTAVLGDARCRFDTKALGYVTEAEVGAVEDARILQFPALNGFEPRWFENGRLEVLDGAAEGLSGMIKNDRYTDDTRRVELWSSLRGDLAPGDRVRLVAGCDKRVETCRLKFANFLNFQGFPNIPGEDWLVSYPERDGDNDGGSLNQ